MRTKRTKPPLIAIHLLLLISSPIAASAGDLTPSVTLPGMEAVRSINPVVGETNDGYLSDIRARPLGEKEVREAIEAASEGPVLMGAIGAGSGTVCFNFKGGIGSASRQLSEAAGHWTLGVLVQSNFGGPLRISGLPSLILGSPLGTFLEQHAVDSPSASPNPDGSLMIVVATDAPLSHRNLRRLAERSLYGMARTGGFGSNGSGDYVIAFSNHRELIIRRQSRIVVKRPVLDNDAMNQLFLACAEATEEAILDSMFTATTTVGFRGTVRSLPVEKVLELARINGGNPRQPNQ